MGVRIHRTSPSGGQAYVQGNALLIEVLGVAGRWGHVLAEIAGSQPEIVAFRAPARPFGESDAGERALMDERSLAMLRHTAHGRGLSVLAVSELRLERDPQPGYPVGFDMVWRRQALAVPLVLGAFSGMYAG